jgi:gliding motility-associated-like protein
MKKILFIIIMLCQLPCLSWAQAGQWTWFGGDTSGTSPLTVGSYGTKGVADPSNWPPVRYQPAYWTDTSGRLWLFGGAISALASVGNDLWMYDPQTKLWTWMSGSQDGSAPNGVWGTLGVPSVNNFPPGKGYGANCWVDKQNNLWLFAGYSYDQSGFLGNSNDLWRYNITTKEWTWMNGSNNISAIVPALGTPNVFDASNVVQGLGEVKSSWVNKDNIAYFFGGTPGSDGTNEIWKYDPAINQFAFIKGGTPTNYGTLGVEAASNMPPARASYTKWQDVNGDFFIFAGLTGFSVSNATNDVWKFNDSSNNWTWVSGSNQFEYSGAQQIYCTPSTTNYPNARFENQTASSVGCSALLWTYGGFANSQVSQAAFNDLWSFNTQTSEWTLASGNVSSNFNAANYGTQGISSPNNKPPAKGGIGIWNDKNYNTWIFGGLTIFDGTIGFNFSNDLWRYVPDTACVKVPGFSSGNNITPPLIQSICFGDTTSTVYDSSLFSITISPDMSASFSTNQVNFSPATTTTYTIISIPKVDCALPDTLIFTITVVPPAQANFTLQNEELNIQLPIANTTNTSTNAVQYAWYLDSVFVGNTISPSINVQTLGEHCLMLVATNSAGCTDTAINCVTVRDIPYIYAPNVFTPNGDKLNDDWHIKTSNVKVLNISIYNRWGQQVFTTKDASIGWDGNFNQQAVEQDTYFYVIRYKDLLDGITKTLAGDVMVLR